MANSKISALTSATTPLAGTETLPIVQSSTTKQVSVANLTAGMNVSTLSLAAGTAASTQTISSTGVISSGSGANINIRLTPKGTAYAEIYANLNGFSATGQSILVLNNTAGSGQSPIDFIINGTLCGRVRTDFAGGVTYVSNGGGHEFYTGGDSGVGTKRLAIASGGDVTVNTGNLIPGTAAKGINFTANTPAAGMTSQLLNWYEEGTWTPNQGGGLTVVGAFSSTGKYTRIGRNVTVSGTVTGATSVALIAAGVITTNLPFTVGTAAHGNVTNVALTSFAAIICTSTNVTSAGAISATGTLTFSATYFL